MENHSVLEGAKNQCKCKITVIYSKPLRERLKKRMNENVPNLFANILDCQLLRSHFVFLFNSLKYHRQQR